MSEEKVGLVGRKIVAIRPMTKEELKSEGWELRGVSHIPMVLDLGDGILLYASQDSEGNGPGAIFGVTPEDNFQL